MQAIVNTSDHPCALGIACCNAGMQTTVKIVLHMLDSIARLWMRIWLGFLYKPGCAICGLLYLLYMVTTLQHFFLPLACIHVCP